MQGMDKADVTLQSPSYTKVEEASERSRGQLTAAVLDLTWEAAFRQVFLMNGDLRETDYAMLELIESAFKSDR